MVLILQVEKKTQKKILKIFEIQNFPRLALYEMSNLTAENFNLSLAPTAQTTILSSDGQIKDADSNNSKTNTPRHSWVNASNNNNNSCV